MLLTNYKHTQPTLGLSVTFVFNIEYIHTYKYTHGMEALAALYK